MPLYEYELCEGDCKVCGGKFTLRRPISAAPLTKCPACKKPVRRVFSTFNSPKTLSVSDAKKAGFTVQVRDVEDVTPTARKLGVPDSLRSCHTSTIGGYVIEGHVPASDVKRLLATKPKATGIAVPGMVVGSPGMEQRDLKEPYKVVLFDKSGKTRVFASH
jgi:putative FmdB family regulatory protein